MSADELEAAVKINSGCSAPGGKGADKHGDVFTNVCASQELSQLKRLQSFNVLISFVDTCSMSCVSNVYKADYLLPETNVLY